MNYNNKKEHITLLGAGLVGSLMSIFLAKSGYKVSVYEKRRDLREDMGEEGRSINLALSNRGWRALNEAGLNDQIKKIVIPMKGRMMHDLEGNLSFLPYGKEGEQIYSVSRRLLNEVLVSTAEKAGVSFYFNQRCDDVNLKRSILSVSNTETGEQKKLNYDILIGADGAFSALRSVMQKTERYNYSQQYIEHGYKEITIPPTPENNYALEENALHIWPRKQFMLIALPNPDKTFTCTLFYPYHGTHSFDALTSEDQVLKFFRENFPDTLLLIPELVKNFFHNPTASLVTIKCHPWTIGNTLLIGDASHAILPFFGQGMNSGFEDCRILNEIIKKKDGNWEEIFSNFQEIRKPDTDAIAKLAYQNFIEMRDLVADPMFLLRKKIEARLHELYPEKWMPLYSMVTFNHIPYSEALKIGKVQEKIMNEVMKKANIAEEWQNLDFRSIIDQLQSQAAPVLQVK